MRVGLLTTVDRIDPYDSLDFVAGSIQRQLFEGLYERDGGRAQPWLADGDPEPVLGDSMSADIRLRAEVRFSDGTPVTPADVVHSLRASSIARRRFSVQEVDAGVRVTALDGDPDIASGLATPWTVITRTHQEGLLGTGPWLLAPGSSPERTRIVPNPHHGGRAPRLDAIDFVTYPAETDGTPRRLLWALERGEAHFCAALSRDVASNLSWLRRSIQPDNSVALLWINVERVTHPEQRAAVLHAIDRFALVSNAYLSPEAFRARCVLPTAMSDFDDGLLPDLRAAKKAFAAAGLKPGSPLRLLVIWGPRKYLPAPRRWAESIARQLGDVGFEVELEFSEDALDYQRRIRENNYDLLLGGWSADTQDSADFLEALFDPEDVPSPDDEVTSGCNFSRLKNKELGRLLLRYRDSRSSADQRAVLEMAASERCVIPLAYGSSVVVHSRAVIGFSIDSMGYPRFSEMDLREV